MVAHNSIGQLVKELKASRTDTQSVEVKEAARKLPSSIAETISAFANTSGGTILLGISEREGFTPVPGFRAKPMADALASACGEKVIPPVRPAIEIVEYAGSHVVLATIPELMPRDKPCYVATRGMYNGSYVRVGDGDRRLSSYEIDRLLEERSQPMFDCDAVPEARIEDLDDDLVAALLRRERELHPRIFASMKDEDALIALHVLVHDESELRPTLAGLLALGTYPQQFFPRLTVAFTAYAEGGTSQVKYVDARTMAGPIPVVLADTLATIRANMRVGGELDSHSFMRRDVPDYPLIAVREAVANALMHRDYSPLARGTAVQVNLYPNRLEITSPGGLYGTVTLDTLGEPGYSSARNQALASILEYTPYEGGFVVENRGTGFQLIRSELARAGMAEVEVHDSLAMFSVTMKREDSGALAPATGDEILRYLAEVGEASASDISAAVQLSRGGVQARLHKLIDAGVVERIGEVRSPKQRYRLA